MTAKHHLTHATQLFYGPADYKPYYNTWGRRGVRWLPQLWVDLGAPITADPNGVVESQAITAVGGPATGINGTLATGGVATFDVPRNIVASWTGTAVMTVTGTDVYGETLVESSPSGTSFPGGGKKAFKTVTAVSVSADVTAATVGTGEILGLPYRVNAADEIMLWEAGVLKPDMSSSPLFAAAVTTSPATATTGDVRGTIDPAATLNGTTATVALQFLNLDPSTKLSLFGVDQYGG